MARILVVHSDRAVRKTLENQASVHHQVQSTKSIAEAMLIVSKTRPDLIVAGLDIKKKDAFELLRQLKDSRADVPTLVLGEAGAGVMQPMVMKMGAVAFLEYPVEQAQFDQTISKALLSDKEAHGTIPPISLEELDSNLSDLERGLNRKMRCFAGKNQVYIQSYIKGYGLNTKPRISLKCPLRREYGEPPNVYYEYIRDVCCGDPGVCPAYQKFRAKNSA